MAPHPPHAFFPGSLHVVALVPLQMYEPQPSLPHAPPERPPLRVPQPPHALAPGSLHVTALPPLQTRVPQLSLPHTAPGVPPVIAPQPPHALLAVWHEVPSQQPPLHVRPPEQLVPHWCVDGLHAWSAGQSEGPAQPHAPATHA